MQPIGRIDNKLFESITLECGANGNPNPIIRWFKDGVALKGPQSIGRVYTIDRINADSRGNYHCEASNAIGTSSSEQTKILIQGTNMGYTVRL